MSQPEPPTAEQVAEKYRTQMQGGFTGLLGMTFGPASADRVEVSVPVTDELRQPYGIVHGGVHSSLVETAASVGAALWFGGRGNVVGVTNTTHFLRAVREGSLQAVATPIHRGRTQQLWLVEIHDDTGRLVARGEVRLANIASAEVIGNS
ncbi:MAG: PaaI family thioesterase [Jatrophihabitans sp.]